MKTFKRFIESVDKNPIDKIVMSVPLFIRCLEWANEEAKNDVEIHKFAEKVIDRCGKVDVLSSYDYEEILP